MTCPVCGSAEYADTVRRDLLPAMQNHVHRTRSGALAAPRGCLVLAVCDACGFAWNRTFDPGLLVYDEEYDNAVPSAVMRSYYEELAAYLGARYLEQGGLVVDVGCGDGTFLQLLCDAVPATCGLGVDPALERDEDAGRVVLRKDVFRAEQVEEQPALVLSRHVLEHMPHPVEFLAEIVAATTLFDPIPCYFEVPDLEWIVDHGAFWDFCYEHCNYFTAGSFAEAMRRAQLTPTGYRMGFGGQYIWNEAITGAAGGGAGPADAKALATRLAAYACEERSRIDAVRERLQRDRDRGASVATWGMATKGVVFSLLVDPDGSLINHFIDVNQNKQGSFVPITGHEISAPEALRELAVPVTVVVMNENYRQEIAATCRDLGIDAELVTMGA